MRGAIFKSLFITFCLLTTIYGLAPIWETPTDSSERTLDISDPNACTKYFNVLAQYLSARSQSGETVYYRIVSQSPNDGAFDIGVSVSSDQIVLCNKDKLKSPSYDVVLGAHHKPRTDTNEATITVKISLKGLRETTPPEFIRPDPDASKENHIIKIDETIQPGDDVITLEATDGEDTGGSTFTFNIDKSNETTRNLFEIMEGSNVLKVRQNVTNNYFDVDRMNARNSFPIVLEVSNGIKATSMSTQIVVEDVNDNAPKFSGNFEASIPRNLKPGDLVLTLNVIDKDKTSPNNQVTLSLAGSDEFEISGNDIVIADDAMLTLAKYTLTVNATDNAPRSSRKSTLQQVTVKLYVELNEDIVPIGAANRNTNMMSAVVVAFVLLFFYHF